jgi:hypothetical protein
MPSSLRLLVEPSPSWEANRSSATQDFVLWVLALWFCCLADLDMFVYAGAKHTAWTVSIHDVRPPSNMLSLHQWRLYLRLLRTETRKFNKQNHKPKTCIDAEHYQLKNEPATLSVTFTYLRLNLCTWRWPLTQNLVVYVFSRDTKGGEHKAKFHVDGRNYTKIQVCKVRQDCAL